LIRIGESIQGLPQFDGASFGATMTRFYRMDMEFGFELSLNSFEEVSMITFQCP
jgi:hypothetical protein